MGPERLRHRVRVRCSFSSAGWLTGTAVSRAFLLGVAIFTAASAGCARPRPVLACWLGSGWSERPGPRSADPDLARAAAGLVRTRASPWRSTGVDCCRRPGCLVLGPVAGGLLVAANWRLVFLVNVPIGAVALLVGWRRLPHVPGHATERPDALGVVLATGGIAALTFGLVEGSHWGWTSAVILASLCGSLVLVGLFIVHCLKSRTPLVHPSLFRSRQFTGASLVAIFFSAAFGAMLLSVVLWDQGPWGWSALRSGLALAPGPIMVPVTAFLVAGRLISRYGPALVVGLGSVMFAAGVAWWALAITLQPDYLVGVLGGIILTRVGVGLTLPTMMATASASLPPTSFATGSAVINMVRQTGLALGVAVLVAVLGTSVNDSSSLTVFRHAWWLIAAVSLIGLAPAAAFLRRPAAAKHEPVKQTFGEMAGGAGIGL